MFDLGTDWFVIEPFFTDGELHILGMYHLIPISEEANRILLHGSPYLPQQNKTPDAPPRPGFVIDSSRSPSKSAEKYYRDVVLQQKTEAVRSELRSLIT